MGSIIGSYIKSPVTKSNVWSLNPFARGQAIEKAFEQNLHTHFPRIDKLQNGVAVSIKSMNLKSKTYQNGTRMVFKLKKYVNELAKFKGAKFSGQEIMEGVHFNKRAIELAIPPDGGTELQKQTLQSIIEYARTKGVDFKVILFP